MIFIFVFFGGVGLSFNITYALQLNTLDYTTGVPQISYAVMPLSLYMLVSEILPLLIYLLDCIFPPLQDSVQRSLLKKAALLPFSLHLEVSGVPACLLTHCFQLFYLCISLRADTFC